MKFRKVATIGLTLLTTLSLAACRNDGDHKTTQSDSQKTASSNTSQYKKSSTASLQPNKKGVAHKSGATKHQNRTILSKLVYYTNHESAGPTHNYYYVNGHAKLSGFHHLKAGNYHFASDRQGRSATARAVLTYSEYQSSEGSRQGDPLAPPSWPADNPEVAIHYSLTDRTYHGYLFNRSHSIADSLLGAKSYTSEYNFTTGTRPQNVGANQDGGMRYAEETAEDYWEDHPGTRHTIDYETIPLYKGAETIPRGSVVNIKSSDDAINTEIVVLNSVEGIKINYETGTSNAKPITHHSPAAYRHSTSDGDTHRSHSTVNRTSNSTTKQGQWTVAGAGMVFVSDSDKFYSEVINPGNYQYMNQSKAEVSGATRALRGNEYARP
ncbi:DNA/RNA non-specific endonuclease [Lentilactobacillus kisonensis]|uniref:DNA RNA non-specific endonuclease n=1 Tax=Lentilactobacillus kisonensis DSM 19906 = JCM 15041 TaxID=1423766 RepID=A0A0R1NZF7_9LACO|nr:DNA/RNA non-specific endonuclease [Lentilactobacillus kisonensis]KRL23125.1 DNA RNA non-specific endonuclease [Lentilactobacillus kisonensis DSM 19906 = JCM 15041]